MSGLRQSLWSLAIVATLLLLILIAASVVGRLYDSDSDPEHSEKESVWINARWLLSFFAIFGWVGVIFSYTNVSLNLSLLISTIAGILAALISRRVASFLLNHPRLNADMEANDLRESVGQVLQPIPPHRNGFGKVHVDKRGVPFEIEAITAGQELPPGVPIRVIDVIDGRVLLVEPINEETPPGQRPPQPPPGHVD